jgi:Na+-transporting NADH:ubiquinone oxidoreductase subunit NqrF
MTRSIRLFVGVRAERDVFLEQEFIELQAKYQNLLVTFALSDPEGGLGASGWLGP